MDDMMALGQQVLDAQPFSALLGIQLVTFAPGSVEFHLEIRPELFQHHGHVHGGALSSLADNALTFAGGSALGPSVLTGGFTISYVRPARGERLVARATVVASGRRQAVCRCDIFAVAGGEETLCAVAQGTIVGTGD